MGEIFKKTKHIAFHILHPQGDISSKRFWGGVLVTNSIFLSWFRSDQKDLINGFLLYGCTLLGAGILDKLTDKKEGTLDASK